MALHTMSNMKFYPWKTYVVGLYDPIGSIGTGKPSCLIIGATVGGAIGTPLLLLIILLLVILTYYVIKRNSDKSKIIMQRNEVYGEGRVIFDETKLNDVKLPYHVSEEDDTYAAIQ